MKRTVKSFFGMALASALGGYAFAILGALIGSKIIDWNSYGGFGGLVGAIAGMILGYAIGVIFGILVFSKAFRYRGSIWLAGLGAILGMVLILGLAEPLNLNSNSNVMLWSLVVLTALFAAWGFHLKKV
ncbi:hypothetical protein Dform_02132 [Dehalogenimonas formicexedens]|uniref:Uncharacterized protein n=1 Tax=Dehalogenimonas formicexedens TaxID=1839801 RepID=A0A1P8FAH1_9CHLR|nr:hypothetical protein [Dehalogenimonas formicexedens]APV45440.1 hypothetical protein Dform_02132 [Dehalogenimonas formicexedens]